METTITQNGALFALQHRRPKRSKPLTAHRPTESTEASVSTLRTSVGDFAFRPTQSGCHVDIIVGKVRRFLGLYRTNEAAIDALRTRKIGFRTWDTLEIKTAKMQLRAANRWSKSANNA